MVKMDSNVILEKIRDMLLALGFHKELIGNNYNYVLGNTYCIPQYIESLGFFIEYTDSKEEAMKNWHEDSDKFPADIGEAAILMGLRMDVIDNFPEVKQKWETISNEFIKKEKKGIAFIQNAAKVRNSCFFIDCGEGREFENDDMYLMDMSGWLIPNDLVNIFLDVPKPHRWNDEWSKYFCFAEWRQINNDIFIEFNEYYKISGIELGIKKDYFHKTINIICKDGQRLTGTLDNWTSKYDNEPDGESIMIETARGDLIEIYTDEIESIVCCSDK